MPFMHLKILFGAYLNHSSLCPSADVKPMPNNLVHVIPWQCKFVLFLFVYYNFYVLDRKWLELDDFITKSIFSSMK